VIVGVGAIGVWYVSLRVPTTESVIAAELDSQVNQN